MSRSGSDPGWSSMSSPGHRLAGRVMAILLVLFATTIYAGCGGSDSASDSTKTVAVTSAGKRGTPPAARSAQGTAAPRSSTSRSTTGPTPGSTPGTSPSPGGRLLRRFTGDGNAWLGTIVVHSPSVLEWSAQHPAIQIFTSNGFMLVNSKAPKGSIRLAGGTYRGVRVASHASWSIELRSLSS